MKIEKYYSPNFDKKKRLSKKIKIIVIHYTGMQSERDSLERLCDTKSKVSSHFLISNNGKIYRLVEDNRIAWHAGKSNWGKYKNVNQNSIGIELVNKGHRLGYENFKKEQINSLIKVCKVLIKKYKINKGNIIGHSDIAPLRKIDPGEKFPWSKLAKKNIGIWHNKRDKLLKKFRNIKVFTNKDKKVFIKNLSNLGYVFREKSEKSLFSVIKAFQRHFRKELINGIIDRECLIIAQNLQEKRKNS
jgi:N-acetylmuramoyl-L-alanine amidase